MILVEAVASQIRAEPEVLAHRELAEEPSALGDVGDSDARDSLRSGPGDALTGEAHLAGGRHEPRDRAERRGLARAVAAEDGDDLSLADRERDTVESLYRAVASLDAVELEQRGHQSATPR